MQRTPRQQTLRSVYRFVATALVVLWGFPLALLWRVPSRVAVPENRDIRQMTAMATAKALAESDTNAGHAKMCCCANCPGGTHCCCGGAHTPSQGLAFRAVCDTETPIVTGVSPVKVAFFPVSALAALPTTAVRNIYTTGDITAPSHVPALFLLPPRLS